MVPISLARSAIERVRLITDACCERASACDDLLTRSWSSSVAATCFCDCPSELLAAITLLVMPSWSASTRRSGSALRPSSSGLPRVRMAALTCARSGVKPSTSCGPSSEE